MIDFAAESFTIRRGAHAPAAQGAWRRGTRRGGIARPGRRSRRGPSPPNSPPSSMRCAAAAARGRLRGGALAPARILDAARSSARRAASSPWTRSRHDRAPFPPAAENAALRMALPPAPCPSASAPPPSPRAGRRWSARASCWKTAAGSGHGGGNPAAKWFRQGPAVVRCAETRDPAPRALNWPSSRDLRRRRQHRLRPFRRWLRPPSRRLRRRGLNPLVAASAAR